MALRMETLRRTFGVAEPVRRGMELRITRQGDWQPSLLKGTPGLGGSARASSVHEDILMGRDESITWEDVFSGGEELRGLGPQGGVHEEMERKLRM